MGATVQRALETGAREGWEGPPRRGHKGRDFSMPQAPLLAKESVKSPLFAGLSDAAWQRVLDAGVVREVEAGQTIFHQGDRARAGYLVLEGRVKVSQVTFEGHEVIVAVLGPGDILGLIAVLAEIPYPASAQAVEPSRLLGWDQETVWELLAAHPRLSLNALHVLAQRFRELQDRYRELATERVEQRIARSLVRLASKFGRREGDVVVVDYPLSREDLAELSGTTLYTASRVLKRWEEAGIVTLGRQRVIICSPHGLVAIAEGERPRTVGSSGEL